jgi:protocatechuate 3,4-dioxygenase beta subunit
MNRHSHLGRFAFASFAIAAAVLVSALPHADAQPAQGAGTIKVTVVDGAGTPIEGLQVQLRRSPRQAAEGPGAGGGAPPVAPNSAAPGALNLQAQGILVASKNTDKAGFVEFTNVRTGSYRVSAGRPDIGRGFSPVRVEANKTHDIKIEVKKDN